MTETVQGKLGRYQKYALDIRRMYERPPVQATVTVVLSILLVTVFLIFAIRPTLVKIAELRTSIKTMETTLATLETKAQSLTKIADSWDKIEPQLPMLEAAIPLGPDYRKIVKEVEVLAWRNEVTLLSLSVDNSLIYTKLLDPYEISTRLDVVPLPITIRVGGTYKQLLAFSQALIGVDRIITIETLAFSPETQSKEESQYPLTLNISAEVYYMAEWAKLKPILQKVEEIN